jgi:hypothetical protein
MSSLRANFSSKNDDLKPILDCLYLLESCLYTTSHTFPSQGLTQLKEDLALTTESLIAKDSVQTLRKQTLRLAKNIYSARLYQLCEQAIFSLKNNSEAEFGEFTKKERLDKLYSLLAEIRSLEVGQSSFYSYSGFTNPYPEHLLFSQKYHAAHFSNKSGRSYVQNKSIDEMAQQLKTRSLSPDDLRVQVYLAQYKGNTYTFSYNNRTWVVFSRAQVPATRIVPTLPTQDLLKRIQYLIAEDHNPNTIYEEVSVSSPAAISSSAAAKASSFAEYKEEARSGLMTFSQKPLLKLKTAAEEKEEGSKKEKASAKAESPKSKPKF